jgi:hypothetical protein
MQCWINLRPSIGLVFCFLSAIAEAQVSVGWVHRYRGPAPSDNDNQAYAIAVDRSGNTYVTGASRGVGFGYDYATVKYGPFGDTLWVKRWRDSVSFNAIGQAIAVDSMLNVYVSGGTVTIKYDSEGNERWVRRNPNLYAGFTSVGKGMLLSDFGHIYVSGQGIGLGGNPDIITWKLDQAGNMLWFRQYDGQDHDADRMFDMAIDRSGNVIVVGESFIIGPQSGYDYITIKYTSNGDTLWTRRYDAGVGDWDLGRGVAVDSLGNIYVTGRSDSTGTGSDALTIKYDPEGNVLWTARYNSPTNGGDTGEDIIVDRSRNVYVTGISQGINYAVHKYSNSGDHLWTQVYLGGGSFFSIIFPRIALDTAGNVYATVRVPECEFYSDFGVVKYDSDGNQAWLARYERPCGSEDAYALVLDRPGNVYLTGYLGVTSVDFDYLTAKFIQGPVSVDESETRTPTTIFLHQNYPNPFNSTTRIGFSLPRSALVTLKVFDLLGQEIATLVKGERSAGDHSILWDASEFPSGIYFYRLQSNGAVQTRKLLILR